MKILYHPIFLEHNTGHHPENADRLKSLGKIEISEFDDGEKYLSLVHQGHHIEQVKNACALGESLDGDTITSKDSYQSAIYAVGAAIEASKTNGIAVVRPPGHHAYPDHSSGFCLFNNIAIAVQNLVNQGKKIFILDFDGHCGDGTEFQFYNTNQVLFLSVHQYPAYPGSGFMNEIGNEKGKGYTINIPLPPGSGDDLYLEALEKYIPIARQFNPDVVAVSAGFDAHHADPLLNLNFSASAYYETGKILSENFKNIFAVMEGGYNLNYLSRCLFNFIAGINGDPIVFSEARTTSVQSVKNEFNDRMKSLKNYLLPYWNF